MTAPLPPLPNERHDTVLNKRWTTADMQLYAKLAVREALERVEHVILNDAGKYETLPEIAYRIRAMLKEYSDD